MNPVKALEQHGQAVWLDFLARGFVAKGDLKRLIDEDGVKGVTSNPAIFEKAIGSSDEYDAPIAKALKGGDRSPTQLFEAVAVEDIQNAADVLRPVYDSFNGNDGFVSLEVSPYLAMDAKGTIAEAEQLWKAVDRRNLMIKVPATEACLPAIQHLISRGISVNITLLFAQEVYRQVAEAYLAGLEAYVADGGDPSHVASVASFFVSRIDSVVDKQLDEKIAQANDPTEKERLTALKGKIAIANAKMAYQDYKRLFSGARWERLAAKGAKPQRLLWASTGTKNKDYSDVLYVEELIGPNTVNTVPPATLDAFRDHGKVRDSLEEDVEAAQAALEALAKTGISLDEITAELVIDGVKQFADAADKLYGAVAHKRAVVLGERLGQQSIAVAADLDKKVQAATEDWRKTAKIRRLWHKDSSVWTGKDEHKWLGWLTCVEKADIADYEDYAQRVKGQKFSDAVVLGMGGSSLGPEVLARTFPRKAGFPRLHVLDSTDPAQVRAMEKAIDISKTVFIVSSKSGGTTEPNAMKDYFFARVSEAIGANKAGHRFIAVTDPGSSLEKAAKAQGFARVFHGEPSIGGRYSVLSPFGLVPAATAGIDVRKLVTNAQAMVRSCGPDVPPLQNPGVQLGLAMGLAGLDGRDKVTIFASPRIADFGAWAEQLIAESTGKEGKGLIPIDGEPIGDPADYGSDRFFIDIRVEGDDIPDHDAKLAALEDAGHPVVRIVISSIDQLGQEFFRWEMATAVAGAALGINPFDQPDVESAKIKTRELTAAFEQTGALPAEEPVISVKGCELYTDAQNAESLREHGADGTLASWLKAHLGRASDGDYIALLGYIEHNGANTDALQRIRLKLRDAKHLATCAEFGPRFLHSTGQAYKGGPDSGVFLQITADDAQDLPIPGQKASFGVIKAAQARGDFDVLTERGRRALRVHLKGNLKSGLKMLDSAITEALSQEGPASMQLGMIGLGRMGGNIVRRLMRAGHSCVVYDRDAKAVAALVSEGATGAASLDDFVGKLAAPRHAWIMLPAGKITEATVEQLTELMAADDVIIDGGNSFWQDDVRRGKALSERGLHYVDVGTSGGVWGLERGYCMMIGGDKAVVDRLDPIFATLAPGIGDIPRTPGRDGRDPRVEQGYIHAGPTGAGHFVKMIHNGIEYGLMQAYAEGFDILRNANSEALPEAHRFNFDLADVAEVWRRGSVIPSWLLDLTASALARQPGLDKYSGYVEDSGEGRWTVNAAIDEAVPAEVLTAALFARFRSRQEHTFAEKILSAMREGFGGHKEPEQHPDPARQSAPEIVKPKADRA